MLCQVPKPQQSKVTDKPRQKPDLTSLHQKYQLEYIKRSTPPNVRTSVFSLTWNRTNNKLLVDPDFLVESKQQPSAHRCRQIETCIGPSCNSVSRETNPQPRQASAARWLEPLAKISIQDGKYAKTNAKSPTTPSAMYFSQELVQRGRRRATSHSVCRNDKHAHTVVKTKYSHRAIRCASERGHTTHEPLRLPDDTDECYGLTPHLDKHVPTH